MPIFQNVSEIRASLQKYFYRPWRMQNPLVKGIFILEKILGKGGWTYVELPGLSPPKDNPFGWQRVCGTIDGFVIEKYHLMPMGNGNLFLPVKAAIRKAIDKHSGDMVEITLFLDEAPTEIPDELLMLLQQEESYDNFMAFTDGQRKAYIDWIFGAKQLETRARRMVNALKKIAKGEQLYDKRK